MRTGSFKQYGRGQRAVTVEETFARGMNFTNTPLTEGFYKTLVNYEFKDDGKILIPRAGFRTMPDTLTEIVEDTIPYTCLQVRHAYLVDQRTVLDDGSDNPNEGLESIRKFVVFGRTTTVEQNDVEVTTVDLAIALDAGVISETPQLLPVPITTPGADPIVFKTRNYTNKAFVHDMILAKSEPKLISASLNGKEYYLTSSGIASLSFNNYDDLGLQANFETVTPSEITPTEAVNYGYNMLKASPYQFADTASSAYVQGSIGLQGILPYSDTATTALTFNAKVGTPITFRLYVDYPSTVNAQYLFKWELRDLQSDAITIYADRDQVYATDTTKIYNVASGDSGVKLTLQPPYRQFSVTVTAYAADAGADQTEPIAVLNFAAYNLVGATTSSLNQIEVKDYDVSTGTGMTTWTQRLVVWGVESAKNILFVSDINNPTYFPFPNNAEIFTEEIVACVPFIDKLLVFTTSALHALSWLEDGSAYVSETIQENLVMTGHDIETITTVKNMVYFKNGNYFYMIVPSINPNSTGELVLAPISNNVTNLLDNFKENVLNILLEMYNPNRYGFLQANSQFDLRLNDFVNYLDGNYIRNVYNMSLIDTLGNTFLTFDFMLNYNSVLRTWTTTIMESNPGLVLPYRQTVTDKTLFISTINTPDQIVDPTWVDPNEGLPPEQQNPVETPYVEGYRVSFELIRPDPLNCEDSYGLNGGDRYLKNWQFIDTGYREHDSSTKKRYRELQFKLNNTEQGTLEYGMGFMIDDDFRKDIYTYTQETYSSDPTNPYFGWIYMQADYAEPSVAGGAAILEDPDDPEVPFPAVQLPTGEYLESNKWVLDFSKLASAVTHKVRVPVSGKGYAPRLKLVSFNEHRYELLTLNWVYRIMNSR